MCSVPNPEPHAVPGQAKQIPEEWKTMGAAQQYTISYQYHKHCNHKIKNVQEDEDLKLALCNFNFPKVIFRIPWLLYGFLEAIIPNHGCLL